MTTNELTQAALKLLAIHDFTVWRNNSGTARYRGATIRLAPNGTPDIIGYGPGGRFVGIEVKTGRDTLNEAQKAWRERAAASGAFVAEVHDIADLQRAIERYRR